MSENITPKIFCKSKYQFFFITDDLSRISCAINKNTQAFWLEKKWWWRLCFMIESAVFHSIENKTKSLYAYRSISSPNFSNNIKVTCFVRWNFLRELGAFCERSLEFVRPIYFNFDFEMKCCSNFYNLCTLLHLILHLYSP